jgi:MFS transporter, DHA3 family, tetracycline resistance protein
MLARQSRLNAYVVYLIYSGVFALAGALIVTVNLVYQVETARLNPLQLVLVGTVLEATAFLLQVPTGVLADVYSRRLAVVLGVFLFGLAFVLEGSFPRFDVILAAQILFGIGATLTDGAEQAWLADEVGEARVGHALLRGTQVGLLGGLLGSVVSVAFASLRLNLPIVIGGALSIVIAVFLVFFMPEQHFHPARQDEVPTWRHMGRTFLDGLRAVRGRSVLIVILAIGLFYGLYSEGVDRLSPAHILKDFSLPSLGPLQPVAWFGVISIASTLLTLAASEIVRRTVDTTNQKTLVRALFVINLVGIAGLLVFALAGNFYLALAALLLFRGYRSVDEPFYVTWLARNIEPKVRATVISMRGQIDAFGQIVGGPPVGALGTVFSIRLALTVCSLILSPVLLLYAFVMRKARRENTAAQLEEEDQATPVS